MKRWSQAGTRVLEVKLLRLAQESDKGLKEKVGAGGCRESVMLPCLPLSSSVLHSGPPPAHPSPLSDLTSCGLSPLIVYLPSHPCHHWSCLPKLVLFTFWALVFAFSSLSWDNSSTVRLSREVSTGPQIVYVGPTSRG